MSFLLTRMFAYFTLVMYLVVGTVVVRVAMPEMTTMTVSSSYFSLFSNTSLNTFEAEPLVAPEIHFAEIKFPVAAIQKKVVKATVIKKRPTTVVALKSVKIERHELPFHEPVVLKKIEMNNVIEGNLVALYQDFSYKFSNVAKRDVPNESEEVLLEDMVSTKLAKNEVPKEAQTEAHAEPVFFEYETPEVVVADVPAPEKTEEPIESKVVQTNTESLEDDILAFDYSGASEDMRAEALSVSGVVTTQTTPKKAPTISEVYKPKKKKIPSIASAKVPSYQEAMKSMDKDKSSLTSQTFNSNVTIQVASTNLKGFKPELGFEIRFQDDLSEMMQDYNSGSITLSQELAHGKMNRTIAVLKRGFTPTNTDIIVEDDTTEMSIPLIEEETFNELMAPYESRGVIGAVLVELDDNTESSNLDVPYSKIVKLDGDLNVTERDDYRYELYLGVKAGNALLSYKDMRGEVTSKIIHVHERELTFDANYFEEIKNENVTLLEEDLLAKEQGPLIISSDYVRQFATDKKSTKVNDHTYKMNFGRTLLGGRKYLELSHQEEPIFVGFRDNQKVSVPSENFMRFVLSRFEGARLGNRCLVQVNLSKKAARVDVAPESVAASLMTYTQVLDSDGKFYDTVGDKSRKIIVVGESQGAPEYAKDGKINFKISYQDGSVEYLGSYCSPNSYLVEQL